MKYLTGIKPTGQVHLGNYISVIQPLISLNEQYPNNEYYCFIADGHSLTKYQKPDQLNSAIINTAATWLSFFPSNSNVYIYRQSQIPEIFEIYWILSCYTAKGLLNRCHAYKTLTEENEEKRKDPDKGIFAGLYNYPSLMAADILTFNPDCVPIGKDQKQHLEITQDIARRFNHIYKSDFFKIPEDVYLSNEEIPGLDGRKMSKSYNNEIPLFCSEKKLRKLIFSISTNSKNEGETKYPEESNVVKLVDLLGNSIHKYDIRVKLFNGESWGNIKSLAFEIINEKLQEKREKYNNFTSSEIKRKLTKNENIVREQATQRLTELKEVIGLQ